MGLAALVMGSALSQAPAAADMVIGVAAPLNGPFAPLGQQLLSGVREAVADVNARGGIAGQKLKVEAVDDGCEAKKAEAVANQLVGSKVRLVVGHVCSAASQAAARVYAAAGIVQISPASLSPRLTEDRAGPGLFRLARRDDAQAGAIADLLLSEFGAARVALIADRSAYGKALSDAVKERINAGGLREAVNLTFEPGEKDFRGLASTLKGEQIDALFVAAHGADTGALKAAMDGLGLSVPVIAGDAVMGTEYGVAAGAAAEGIRVAFLPDATGLERARPVVERLRARKDEALGYTLPAYAAVELYATAVAEAGSPDGMAVAAALQAGRFETVLGPLRFLPSGDADLPGFAFYDWREGAFRPVARTD
ncbi:ABC transporter substrate-binding protein [Microvirga tunisiensis]|uniref:ABC transporter substrate-binding protein n=1 Tax=Pannonibacter tanglangensis TaxID=2750084 RepID=A0A7X5J8G9_9HYPH|nr:branched-chain amino acid ABC transporter substrate-binding protein [Pannonibacter sp. XCT-53]NBN77235.1 ABC transporter substrate-binding protein [Pannonibacter sp. XCT-53]